ncbi:hypothetical protein I4J89_11345 [Actinoplanes sp. NEAU-A11]|uniref:Uncharacterized protein n=1 Tax=Actinoplanes aureus TaxID=2792083 RepID=A0A931C7E3_9ACTN|nr:hypothetical protein [Actinoplanes aureus]
MLAGDPAGPEPDPARLEALVVRLRTVEQQRDAWQTRCEGLAGERDQEREAVQRLRASGSYRLGRTLVTFVRDPLHSSPRLLRRLVHRVRRHVPAPPKRSSAAPALPTHLYVAIGLRLPALRSFVLALRRRLLVEPDHRAVVLTDDPGFSLLRKSALVIEYLPDRQTWHRHRPDRPWDGVLADRLARLSREHAAVQVIFIDPEHPPTLADLLRQYDTTMPVQRSLQQS